jgi:hypothetical protein
MITDILITSPVEEEGEDRPREMQLTVVEGGFIQIKSYGGKYRPDDILNAIRFLCHIPCCKEAQR